MASSCEFLGSVELEQDADALAQELFNLGHYSSLVSQKMVVDSRIKCSCTKEQLHGLGGCCESCCARRDLNRATRQFKQSKKLAGY